MKILSNKKYNELKDETIEIKQNLIDLRKKYDETTKELKEKKSEITGLKIDKANLESENKKLQNDVNISRLSIRERNNVIDIKNNEIDKIKHEKFLKQTELKATLRRLHGRIGGLTNGNHKLIKENEKLKARVKELQSNRYKVIDLPPTKPKKQKTRIKKGVVNASVAAILRSKNEEEN